MEELGYSLCKQTFITGKTLTWHARKIMGYSRKIQRGGIDNIRFWKHSWNFCCYCTFVPPLGLGLGLRLALSCISSWWVINDKKGAKWKYNSAEFFTPGNFRPSKAQPMGIRFFGNYKAKIRDPWKSHSNFS